MSQLIKNLSKGQRKISLDLMAAGADTKEVSKALTVLLTVFLKGLGPRRLRDKEAWWGLNEYQNEHHTMQQLAGNGTMITHRAQEAMYAKEWKDCSMG